MKVSQLNNCVALKDIFIMSLGLIYLGFSIILLTRTYTVYSQTKYNNFLQLHCFFTFRPLYSSMSVNAVCAQHFVMVTWNLNWSSGSFCELVRVVTESGIIARITSVIYSTGIRIFHFFKYLEYEYKYCSEKSRAYIFYTPNMFLDIFSKKF